LAENIPIDFHRQRQSMPEGVAAGLRSLAAVLGAVLLCALARLAAICFSLAIEAVLLLGGIVSVAVVPAGSALRLLEQHAAAT
jgi:hypothetical protein